MILTNKNGKGGFWWNFMLIKGKVDFVFLLNSK